MKIAKSKKITETAEYQITGEDIIAALKETGRLPKDAECKVTFNVPGGGDWSNTSIEIDNSHPIYINTTTELCL